jgi:uncharacterized membrane-anchored protein
MTIQPRYTALRRSASHMDKLAALLPAEMIAGYTALNGLVSGAADLTGSEKIVLLWVTFGFALLITIIYLIRKNRELDSANKMTPWQILVTTVSFAIWALAIGGVMRESFAVWKVTYENLIVAAWTWGSPFLVPGKP